MQLNRRQLLAATAIPAIGLTASRDTLSKPSTRALVTLACVESAFAAVVASRSNRDIDHAAAISQLYVRQGWSDSLKSFGRDNKVLDDAEMDQLTSARTRRAYDWGPTIDESHQPCIIRVHTIRVHTDQPVWDIDSLNRPAGTGLRISRRLTSSRFRESIDPCQPVTEELMGTSPLAACFVGRAASALAGSNILNYPAGMPCLSFRVFGMPRCRLVLADNNDQLNYTKFGGGGYSTVGGARSDWDGVGVGVVSSGSAGGFVLSLSFYVLVALPD